MYCAGFLSYRFLEKNESLIYLPEYVNAVVMLSVNTALIIASEILRKRGVELSFHAGLLGDWTK
jgi:hypothetical protein